MEKERYYKALDPLRHSPSHVGAMTPGWVALQTQDQDPLVCVQELFQKGETSLLVHQPHLPDAASSVFQLG